jgi:hypothetical protein
MSRLAVSANRKFSFFRRPRFSSACFPTTAESADDSWRVGFTPYLWFGGVHGTVGALGHQTGVHASFGDIFSNLNIGLMGEMEARKNFSGSREEGLRTA